MAGPKSNYADEISQAIQVARDNQLSPILPMRWEPPATPDPNIDPLLRQDPTMAVPVDVAQMILGMQRARGRQ